MLLLGDLNAGVAVLMAAMMCGEECTGDMVSVDVMKLVRSCWISAVLTNLQCV